MPGMLTTEDNSLVADIEANGLRQPITLFQGLILDGRHRYAACQKLGLTPTTEVFTGSEEDARLFVLSANLHRRHLTLEQKKAIVEAELKRDPAQSDRSIAKKAKVDHKTVATERPKRNRVGKFPSRQNAPAWMAELPPSQ